MTRFFDTSVGPKAAAFGLGAAVVVSIASLLVFRLKLSKRKQQLKPSKGPSTNYEHIDTILYKASNPNCDDEYDVIVIGSGIGGLTTASLLAQRGYKVLVLEQHVVCGGCCHTFKSGGYRFGTGIHYVGGVEEPGIAKNVLKSITYKDDPIKWDRLPRNYDTLVLGSGPDMRRYEFVGAGWSAQKQHLKEQFPPEDHDAIDEYYTLVHDGVKSFRNAIALKLLPLTVTKFLTRTGLHKLFDGNFEKYASKSLLEVVSSITENEDLRAVLCYNWGDHGCEPKNASFAVQAGLFSHYMYGAYYPSGGPASIAQKIIPTIIDNGGMVLANAPVKEITAQGGRVTGVAMKDGRKIRAKKAVVSDAGIFATIEHLLQPEMKARSQLSEQLLESHGDMRDGKLHASTTGLYLFVGLKGDHDDDLHLPHTQHWVFGTANSTILSDRYNHLSLDEGLELQPKDIFLFISSPSGKDSQWKSQYPGKSTLEIMTFVPSTWFQEFAPQLESASGGGSADPGGKPGMHGEKYEDAKKKLAQLMWARAAEVLKSAGATIPSSLDEVDHYELGTPLTFAHYYRRDGGAWYGTANDLSRYGTKIFYERIRPEIPEAPGLFLTGQDANEPGFVGAMLGGLLCASKVVGVTNPMALLVDD